MTALLIRLTQRLITPIQQKTRKPRAFAYTVPALTAFLILVSGSPLFAQTFTGGGIGGQITDPSGKAVSGATVEATEIATQTSAATTSNAEGEYQIERLKPGVYRVTISASGFKSELIEDLQVQLDRTFRLDKQLALGSATDTVSVVATDTSINYESPEISTTLGAEEVEELPLVNQEGRGRKGTNPATDEVRSHRPVLSMERAVAKWLSLLVAPGDRAARTPHTCTIGNRFGAFPRGRSPSWRTNRMRV